METKKIVDYFKNTPEDFPLGYMYIELIPIKKSHRLSSRSKIHNSECYLGKLFYKELSNVHKYKKKQ